MQSCPALTGGMKNREPFKAIERGVNERWLSIGCPARGAGTQASRNPQTLSVPRRSWGFIRMKLHFIHQMTISEEEKTLNPFFFKVFIFDNGKKLIRNTEPGGLVGYTSVPFGNGPEIGLIAEAP